MSPSTKEPEDRELELANEWLYSPLTEWTLAESLATLLCRYRAEVLEEIARNGA